MSDQVYNIDVNVYFDQEYKKEINSLESSLNKIKAILKEVAKTAEAASNTLIASNKKNEHSTKEVENALNKVENQVKQLSSANERLEQTNLQLSQAMIKNESSAAQLDQKLGKLIQGLDSVKGSNNNLSSSFSESVSTALKSISIWDVATKVFSGVKIALENVVTTIKELDEKMLSLHQVMNPLTTDFNYLKKQAIDLAMQFGVSINDVIDSMVLWGQQGKNQAQVLKLTEASILASNVTQMKAGQAVKYLTAATKQFKIPASEASTIVDKWNEVSNNFATSSIDLAESIKETGTAANNAGVTIDELIGMTTSLTVSTGKTGEQIGSSLNSIFSNLSGVGEEGISTLSGINQILGSIENSLISDLDIYNDTTDVLSNLAMVWDNLSTVTQTNIAHLAGGKEHYLDFIALMENWDIATQATETSINSLNSATGENEEYMDSLSGKLGQAQAAIKNVSIALGDAGLTEIIKKVLDTVRHFFKGLEYLIEQFQGLDLWVKQLMKMAALTGIIWGLVAAFNALKFSISPWLAGISLAATAIGGLITQLGKEREEIDKVRESTDLLVQVGEDPSRIDSKEFRDIQVFFKEFSTKLSRFKELYKIFFDESGAKSLTDPEKIEWEKLIEYFIEKTNIKFTSEYMKDGKLIQYTDAISTLEEWFQDELIIMKDFVSDILEDAENIFSNVNKQKQDFNLLQQDINGYKDLVSIERTSEQEVAFNNYKQRLIDRFPEFKNIEDSKMPLLLDEKLKKYKSAIDETITNAEDLISRYIFYVSNSIKVTEKEIKLEQEKFSDTSKDAEQFKINDKSISDKKNEVSNLKQVETILETYLASLESNIDKNKLHNLNILVQALEVIKNAKDKKSEMEQSVVAIKSELDASMNALQFLSFDSETDKLDTKLQYLKKAQNDYKNIFKQIKLFEGKYSNPEEFLEAALGIKIENLPEELQKQFKELGSILVTMSNEMKNEISTNVLGQISETQKQIDKSEKQINLSELFLISFVPLEKKTKSELQSMLDKIDEELKNNSNFALLNQSNLIEIEIAKIDKLERLQELQQIMSSLTQKKPWEIPVLTGNREEDILILSKDIKNTIESLKNQNLDELNSTDVLANYLTQLKQLGPQIEYYVKQYGEIDLIKLGIPDKDAFLININNLIKSVNAKIKGINLSDVINKNISETFSEEKLLQQQIDNSLDILSEAFALQLPDEDIKKAEEYFWFLLEKYDELLKEKNEQNIFGSINESLKETKELIESFDLSQIIGIESAEKALALMEEKLKSVQDEKDKFVKENLGTEDMQEKLKIFGLTEEEIQKIMKTLEEYIDQTKYSWSNAFTIGIKNSLSQFEDLDDLKSRMRDFRQSLVVNIGAELMNFQDGRERIVEFAKTISSGLAQAFNLSDVVEKSISVGILATAEALSSGNLGLALSIGIGSAIGSAFGNQQLGGVIGNVIGQIGTLIVGKSTGVDDKNYAEQLNKQIDDAKKKLQEYGIEMDVQKASWRDMANWWENLWGKDEWKVFNLENAEQSLEEMQSMIARLEQSMSTLGQGFAEGLKNATTYSDFAQHFKASIGQALLDALVDALMKKDVIADKIKELSKLITLAVEDGNVDDNELNKIKQVYESMKETMKDTFEVVDELKDDEFFADVNAQTDNNFTAGSSSNITYHQQFIVKSEYFGGSEEEAEEFARKIVPFVRVELARNAGA